MRRRIIPIILAFCTLIPLASTASARASEYLERYSVLLLSKSNGQMGIDMSVIGTRQMSRIGILEVYIEEKNSSTGSWHEFDTISGVDNASTYYDNNSWDYLRTVYFNGTVGRYYRVTLTVHAVLDGVGSDTGTVTSTTVLCK